MCRSTQVLPQHQGGLHHSSRCQSYTPGPPHSQMQCYLSDCQRRRHSSLQPMVIHTVSTNFWAALRTPRLIGTLTLSVCRLSTREGRHYKYNAQGSFRSLNSTGHLTSIASSKDSKHFQIRTSKVDLHRSRPGHWDNNNQP